MKSALDYDKKIQKEFKIDESVDQDMVFKIAHVRTQIEEIKKFLWRERVELILGESQAESTDELVAQKGRSNVAEKRSNIKQVVRSIRTLTGFLNELEAQEAEPVE